MLILILVEVGMVRLEPELGLIISLLLMLISLLRPLHGVMCHRGYGFLDSIIR